MKRSVQSSCCSGKKKLQLFCTQGTHWRGAPFYAFRPQIRKKNFRSTICCKEAISTFIPSIKHDITSPDTEMTQNYVAKKMQGKVLWTWIRQPMNNKIMLLPMFYMFVVFVRFLKLVICLNFFSHSK